MAKLALQLYTVRDHLEQDFEGTIRKVAELGFQGVEFAGYYGRTQEQVKELLAETGLTVVGAHVSLDRMLNHADEEMEFNRFIGNDKLIIPYVSEEDRNWPEVIRHLQAIGEKVSAGQMTLLYHNHDFELTEQLEGKPVLDVIFDTIPASALQVELDSCWVDFAGKDAVAYIQKYQGRLPLLHWKDAKRLEDGSAQTLELGQGQVNVARIADAAIEAGVEWLVVEQDHSVGDSLENVRTSMNFVKEYQKSGGRIHV